MACSRTPKWIFLPSGVSELNAFDLLIHVIFEGARSAEPPTNSGKISANKLITLPDETLDAIPFSSAGNSTNLSCQFSGSFPSNLLENSFANSG